MSLWSVTNTVETVDNGNGYALSCSHSTPEANVLDIDFSPTNGKEFVLTGIRFKYKNNSLTAAKNWSILSPTNATIVSGALNYHATAYSDSDVTYFSSPITVTYPTFLLLSLSGATCQSTILVDDLTFYGYERVTADSTFTTAQNGNWTDAATWQGGVVPTADDDVVIKHRVEVNVETMRNAPAQTTVDSNGNLVLAANFTVDMASPFM